MEHGGAPDALSFHIGEHGPATMFEEKAWQKTAQKVLADNNSMPIGMYAIGVSFLTLAAMLVFRMRRGQKQATAFASSGGQEPDRSIALVSLKSSTAADVTVV